MEAPRRTLAPMAAWNAASWIVAGLYAFATSRLVFQATGDAGYGVWATVGAMRGFVLFLDGGLGASVTRDSALTEGREACDGRIRAAWRLYGLLAVVALALTALAAGLPEALLGLSGERAETARGVTLVLGADTALALAGSPLLSILRGRQRFGSLAAVNLAQSAVGIALLVVLLPRWGVLGAAVAVGAARAVALAGAWIAMRPAGLLPGGPDRGRIADAARFAAPLWMISFGTLLGMGVDTLVVGGFYGADTASRYAQGTLLPATATGILYSITGAAFPRMVAASPGEPRRWIGAQFFLATFLSAIGFGFIAMHEEALLTVWLGRAAPLAVTVGMISCLAWMLNAPANVLANLAIARGVHGVLGPIVLVEAIANIALTMWLASSWSPTGPAVATLATIFLSNIVVVPLVLRPRLEMRWAEIVRPCALGWGLGLAGAALVAAVTWAVRDPFATVAVGAAVTIGVAGLVLETSVRRESKFAKWARVAWRGGWFVRRDQRREIEAERARLAELRRTSPIVWVKEKPPLVSVRIATYNRGRLVADRAIASALAQTHANLEVVVVGDKCDDATAEAVLSVKDPRVRFVNLPERGKYPADPMLRWMVAGAAPMNHALDIARGEWIAPLDDDDEFTADHVEALLDACRSRSLEFAWGIAEMEQADGTWKLCGSEPLAHGQIIHASVLWSSRVRIRHDIRSWRLDEPGDWNVWSRMRDAGVRMGFVDRVVCRHYRERREVKVLAPFWSGDR